MILNNIKSFIVYAVISVFIFMLYVILLFLNFGDTPVQHVVTYSFLGTAYLIYFLIGYHSKYFKLVGIGSPIKNFFSVSLVGIIGVILWFDGYFRVMGLSPNPYNAIYFEKFIRYSYFLSLDINTIYLSFWRNIGYIVGCFIPSFLIWIGFEIRLMKEKRILQKLSN